MPSTNMTDRRPPTPVAGSERASFSCQQPRPGGDRTEDNCLADDRHGLYVVADGMGGYEFGQDASELVVQTVHTVITQEQPAAVVPNAERLGEDELQKAFLSYALGKANVALCKLASERAAPLGSTGTLIRLDSDRLWGAHVGDCRVYLFDDQGEVKQLTRDHRPAGKAGSNRLERSLGHSLNIACDTFTQELPKHFGVLLCCDGVWAHLSEGRLSRLVLDTAAAQVAATVVAEAVANGSDDDVTAVYVESLSMTTLKKERRVQALESEVAAGSRDPAVLEELLTGYADRRDARKIAEYLSLYVAALGKRPPDSHLLPLVLDLAREQSPDKYAGWLRDLRGAGHLPAERLADLTAGFLEAEDLGSDAQQVYEDRLRQDVGDVLTRGYHGLCLLRRGEEVKAERELIEALQQGDDPLRERLLQRLKSADFGTAGQELHLRLAVELRRPGVAEEVIARIEEAGPQADATPMPAQECLLRQIAEQFPAGRDRRLAQSKLAALHEQRESSRLKREVERLQTAAEHTQEEMRRLEKENSDQRNTNNRLTRELEAMRREQRSLENSVESLEDERKKAERESQDLRRKYHKLNEECTALRKRCSSLEDAAAAWVRGQAADESAERAGLRLESDGSIFEEARRLIRKAVRIVLVLLALMGLYLLVFGRPSFLGGDTQPADQKTTVKPQPVRSATTERQGTSHTSSSKPVSKTKPAPAVPPPEYPSGKANRPPGPKSGGSSSLSPIPELPNPESNQNASSAGTDGGTDGGRARSAGGEGPGLSPVPPMQ